MKIEIDDELYAGSKCSICGDGAMAMWRGDEDIFVCRRCAVKVLPELIADAVYEYRLDTSTYKEIINELLSHFWFSLFSNEKVRKKKE